MGLMVFWRMKWDWVRVFVGIGVVWNWVIMCFCAHFLYLFLVWVLVGKTLQTISLLAYLRESRGVKGPHLCVVPKSVVGNWIREFKKWCPSIRAVRMLGTKEERKRVVKEELKPNSQGKVKFDVIVTSYEGILKEKAALGKIDWKYIIIDEAHRIKNENSSLSKCVRL